MLSPPHSPSHRSCISPPHRSCISLPAVTHSARIVPVESSLHHVVPAESSLHHVVPAESLLLLSAYRRTLPATKQHFPRSELASRPAYKTRGCIVPASRCQLSRILRASCLRSHRSIMSCLRNHCSCCPPTAEHSLPQGGIYPAASPHCALLTKPAVASLLSAGSADSLSPYVVPAGSLPPPAMPAESSPCIILPAA